MAIPRDPPASAPSATWAWAMAVGGALFTVGGLLHPTGRPGLPEPPATAVVVDLPTWVPANALLVLGALGFAIGLGTLARGSVLLTPGGRAAAWVATAGALLLAVEYAIHLRVYAADDMALARAAVPFLSTHTVTSTVVYPVFFLAVAALAVLSGRTLTNRAVGLVGAAGALIWGVAPALVELAGVDLPTLLFAVGGLLSTAWFTAVGVTGLVRRRSARVRA